MIGALALINRRKKLANNGVQESQTMSSSTIERCNVLFVAAVVFIILALIVFIPVCFGDKNFLMYSGLFFSASIVILIIAFFVNITKSEEETCQPFTMKMNELNEENENNQHCLQLNKQIPSSTSVQIIPNDNANFSNVENDIFSSDTSSSATFEFVSSYK